jgi:hypothetical protein
MTNQTIKKDPNNRGEEELKARLRSLWLGLVDTFQEEIVVFTSKSEDIIAKYIDYLHKK